MTEKTAFANKSVMSHQLSSILKATGKSSQLVDLSLIPESYIASAYELELSSSFRVLICQQLFTRFFEVCQTEFLEIPEHGEYVTEDYPALILLGQLEKEYWLALTDKILRSKAYWDFRLLRQDDETPGEVGSADWFDKNSSLIGDTFLGFQSGVRDDDPLPKFGIKSVTDVATTVKKTIGLSFFCIKNAQLIPDDAGGDNSIAGLWMKFIGLYDSVLEVVLEAEKK